MEDQVVWQHNDGGRSESGFKGAAGDCVTRAISIATEVPYSEVYEELSRRQKHFAETHRSAKARRLRKKPSARDGVCREGYQPYLSELGYEWVPTMKIGSGCKVHLCGDELPTGRIIVRLSRHLAAVVNGVIQDTYDCSRNGTRCVYGYFRKAN